MYYAGIDIGSISSDAVIIDKNENIISYNISPTGANSKSAGEKSFDYALKAANLSRDEIKYIVATGYGRISVPFANKAITEITCHAKGAYKLFPNTKIIIDIGGQDSKVIKIGEGGKVLDFAMNDKCAAGTGRFLEVMARALEIPLEEMGHLSFMSKEEIAISSMCTVFAESEVVSLVSRGKPKEDIVNGINTAICNRILSMADRLGIEPQITMTGGVAKNVGIVKKIEQKIKLQVNISEEPQIAGALGAAILALYAK
ncbi:MAG: 2-hydroxyglutaryl-CoA dehydratase [Desulfobacterales bacterium]|nr:2-hydroxyglutaryl-CoA dehydratase [Desulfobacterales bacterium]MBF0398947.1 2-hydroxyglutaryl-CoA dehydratase [Desulfobacterales bacterium]